MTIPESLRPVVAITQARVGSSRLPRKVLLPVAGEPMLWWHLTRLQRAKTIDRIVVATTDEPEAAAIVAIADRLGIASFRGSTTDVLSRYAGAAALADAKTVIRVTSDCPLIDPALLDEVVTDYAAAAPECQYFSLDVSRYPRGLDCEVFPRAALDEAAVTATEPEDREHVTTYIRKRADRFHPRHLSPDGPVTPGRWCVDTAEDFALVTHILETLGSTNPNFGWRDVETLLDAHPDWRALNADIVQKAL